MEQPPPTPPCQPGTGVEPTDQTSESRGGTPPLETAPAADPPLAPPEAQPPGEVDWQQQQTYEVPLAGGQDMVEMQPMPPQHEASEEQVYQYTYRSSPGLTTVPGGTITTSQPRSAAEPLSGQELNLLLAEREAEDLTAARRSPADGEQRRTAVIVDTAPASPRYGAPLASLHTHTASDSPSPKDMSAGSSAHYATQYSSLAPAQVFTEPLSQYSALPPSPTTSYTSGATQARTSPGTTGVYVSDPYYRDYYSAAASGEQYSTGRAAAIYADGQEHAQFAERYLRPGGAAVYKLSGQGLTVDLPSPDSGIDAEAATPRDQTTALQQGAGEFQYVDVTGQSALLGDPSLLRPALPTSPSASRQRPWHDLGRQAEVDKIHIPKIYGFRFFLEAPISTSQRREDDRLTYVNKGQFYAITMEYVPDPDKPLKASTVKSIILLTFREEKSIEDETKAWQFWHSRQHSVKQRLLDIDTKNSVGLVSGVDEIAHNAIAVYWNPLESSAKVSVALQCLSTDFSSQKGVKGLPLHIQIDTYEDWRDPAAEVAQRSYCQVKSFCDKGAERKTRDEERRASKRRMTPTGRKKMEEMYHPSSERTEFYSMADTTKITQLFRPDLDTEKVGNVELQNYYAQQDSENHSMYDESSEVSSPPVPPVGPPPGSPDPHQTQYSLPPAPVAPLPPPPPELIDGSVRDDSGAFLPLAKRARLTPPLSQRVMLYARQEQEQVYTPLHVAPPTTAGLLHAIQSKYKINASCAKTLCRKSKKGTIAIMDDDMITHYCNEDTFILEIRQAEQDGAYHITMVEVGD